MAGGYRRLPPIAVLRTFEAAARHEGFTAAARELCITHSAVSQHVRTLEERVGRPLFQRVGPAMRPTAAGRRLAEEVRHVLDALSGLFPEEPAAGAEGEAARVTLETMAPIADHWLLPRLPDFRARHPEIALSIRTTPDLVSLDVDEADDVDLALRYGDGAWRGLERVKLADETVFPICSPAFLAAHPGLRPDDLRVLPTLHHSMIPWRHWLVHAGLGFERFENSTAFSDVTLTMKAALLGQGVALGRRRLVADHLREGRLVRPFDIDVPGTYGYWLAWRPAAATEPAVERLRAWIVDRFAQEP